MKLEYYSDIHNEFRKGRLWYPITVDDKYDTVLILAGDIDTDLDRLENYLNELSEVYRHVIFVPGNHEYFGNGMFNSVRELMLDWSTDKVSVLDRGSITIDDHTFIGATLWTDFHCEVECMSVSPFYEELYDFKMIAGEKTMFKPMDMLHEFRRSSHYISEELKHTPKENVKVVITHFPPSYKLKHDRWPDNYISKYFCPNIDNGSFELVDKWIYGHTHDNVFAKIDGCLFESNQIGYPQETPDKLIRDTYEK